jgi:hypothetical protein
MKVSLAENNYSVKQMSEYSPALQPDSLFAFSHLNQMKSTDVAQDSTIVYCL